MLSYKEVREPEELEEVVRFVARIRVGNEVMKSRLTCDLQRLTPGAEKCDLGSSYRIHLQHGLKNDTLKPPYCRTNVKFSRKASPVKAHQEGNRDFFTLVHLTQGVSRVFFSGSPLGSSPQTPLLLAPLRSRYVCERNMSRYTYRFFVVQCSSFCPKSEISDDSRFALFSCISDFTDEEVF